MRVEIIITLKKAVRDPQGRAIADALTRMGFERMRAVRQGKHIEIDMEQGTQTHEQIKAQVKMFCEKLLVNPVIEDYQINIDGTK